MLKVTRALSLIILLIGVALIARTIMLAGVTMSAGMIAGLAFSAYGGVRLYYLKGSR